PPPTSTLFPYTTLFRSLQQEPTLSDVASDLQNQGLQAYVEIHRDQAARLGVSVAQITNALYSAFGQRQIATLFTQANQYRVVLRSEEHTSELQSRENLV